MKELSIKEKAKAYDKVVGKLKGFMMQGVDPLITRADVQDFFPEIAESEDEKIRRELITYFRNHSVSVGWSGLNVKKAIEWLEKQGEQNPAEWSEEDEKTLNEIFSVAARASLRKSTLFGKSYDYIKWQKWLKSSRQKPRKIRISSCPLWIRS